VDCVNDTPKRSVGETIGQLVVIAILIAILIVAIIFLRQFISAHDSAASRQGHRDTSALSVSHSTAANAAADWTARTPVTTS